MQICINSWASRRAKAVEQDLLVVYPGMDMGDCIYNCLIPEKPIDMAANFIILPKLRKSIIGIILHLLDANVHTRLAAPQK